jgi:hypothetical protein
MAAARCEHGGRGVDVGSVCRVAGEGEVGLDGRVAMSTQTGPGVTV